MALTITPARKRGKAPLRKFATRTCHIRGTRTVPSPNASPPPGERLFQGHLPVAPYESKAAGIARAELLLDTGFPGWRERTTWRREALAAGRTGAVDPPGTTWRDRPAIDRGHGVYLAGDQVAAPGVLSEVAFNSAMAAASMALKNLNWHAWTRVTPDRSQLRQGPLDPLHTP